MFFLGFMLRKTFVEWTGEGVVPGFLCPLCLFCLGCFVDSRLQVRNSSNRWVKVFFLGFNVLVHPSDGVGGMYPGVCHVMWRRICRFCEFCGVWGRCRFLQKLQNLMVCRGSSVAYLSWSKKGCLVCFVDSRLSIRSSSNR